MKTKKCSCGAEIHFIKHFRGGGFIPCETEKSTIVKPDGKMVQGFAPHWAKCPHAKNYRREKQDD
jgi:hypothetical protein